jgi:hypothetical protein
MRASVVFVSAGIGQQILQHRMLSHGEDSGYFLQMQPPGLQRKDRLTMD